MTHRGVPGTFCLDPINKIPSIKIISQNTWDMDDSNIFEVLQKRYCRYQVLL